MKRKEFFSVNLETNGPKKAVLKEIFDHPPTLESLREAYRQAVVVIDTDVENYVKSDDSSEDEIHDEGVERMRDELFRLDELISTIKPAGMVEAYDKGHHTIMVAGCRVGHIDIEKATYLSKETDVHVEQALALTQSVGVVVERRGPRFSEAQPHPGPGPNGAGT